MSKPVQQFKKYTVQPTGIYRLINKIFAVDSGRSSGVPFNSQFRYPAPGAVDPNTYDDPTTIPAADIAENPYWKRDVRRRYPRLSVIKPADVVGLLSVGSAAAPKAELIGEAGTKQLVSVKEEGEKGLAAFFEKDKTMAKNVLNENGLPPFPGGLHNSPKGEKQYGLLKEQSYGGDYPCRTFQ